MKIYDVRLDAYYKFKKYGISKRLYRRIVGETIDYLKDRVGLSLICIEDLLFRLIFVEKTSFYEKRALLERGQEIINDLFLLFVHIQGITKNLTFNYTVIEAGNYYYIRIVTP